MQQCLTMACVEHKPHSSIYSAYFQLFSILFPFNSLHSPTICTLTAGMIIRYSDVDARWTNASTHTLLDLQAFNTDGFDVTGEWYEVESSIVLVWQCNVVCSDVQCWLSWIKVDVLLAVFTGWTQTIIQLISSSISPQDMMCISTTATSGTRFDSHSDHSFSHYYNSLFSLFSPQDDCIAVKDCPTGSYNMLFERISCSGLGKCWCCDMVFCALLCHCTFVDCFGSVTSHNTMLKLIMIIKLIWWANWI